MVATVGRCYTNPNDYAQENYYSSGEGFSHSEWWGKAAAAQGLNGQIQAGDFHNAYQALDPQGNPLRRQQNYRQSSQRQNRPGTDVTLSAPKSISVAALVMGEQSVMEAHKAAVRATMNYVENHCIFYQTKQRGKKLLLQSQAAQIAVFHHDDNRNQDPQLHSHCVILNQTHCPDGKYRAVANAELYRQQKTIGAYYAHCLARELQRGGWQIEWTDDHTFELAGANPEQINAVFSTRSNQIEATLAQAGLNRSNATAAQKQAACLKTRKHKKQHHHPADREEQRELWQHKAREAGIEISKQKLENIYQLPSQPANEIESNRGQSPADFEAKTSIENPNRTKSLNDSTDSSVQNLVDGAIATLTTRATAFHSHELLRECLRQSQGRHQAQQIETAIEQLPSLVPTQDGRLTTQLQLTREQKIIKTAQDGRNRHQPLASDAQAQAIATAKNLNPAQTAALVHMATSRDAIILVQGNAGVGKTYTMKALKELIDAQDSSLKQNFQVTSLLDNQTQAVEQTNSYLAESNTTLNPPIQSNSNSAEQPFIPIRGLAPSAAAADVLEAESGISSQTLASYLLTPKAQLTQPAILLVDEAGMLSTSQIQQLQTQALVSGSRIILVGDTKQLAAVEAGAPFKQLQDIGLSTAIIDHNLRQKDPHLKQIVNQLANHDCDPNSINQAYGQLLQQGKIKQIPQESQRIDAVVRDYLNRPEAVQNHTLILAGTNADKQAISTAVRQGLIEAGSLGSQSQKLQTLKRKNLDRFAITQAHHYQRGDVIKFQTESAQFSRDFYYRVTGVNRQTNQLHLIDAVGSDYILPLDKYKQREVYQVQTLEIRPGEQMRFTKNQRTPDLKQINGQRFTVDSLTPDGNILIKTKSQTLKVAPSQLLHSDYRYVDTVHSSQGQTADYCIYSTSAPKSLTVGRESFYVAASRARQEFVVYTADAKDLGVTVSISRANENALDLVQSSVVQTQRQYQHEQPLSSNQTEKQFTQSKPEQTNITELESQSAQTNLSQSDRLSLPPTAITKSESNQSDESKQRTARVEPNRNVTGFDGVIDSLTDSSRRAEKLADNFRDISSQPQTKPTASSNLDPTTKQYRNNPTAAESGRPSSKCVSEALPSAAATSHLRATTNHSTSERTRELQRLEQRAKGTGRKNRTTRKTTRTGLSAVAAQFRAKIQQFAENIGVNSTNPEEREVWSTRPDWGSRNRQTARTTAESGRPSSKCVSEALPSAAATSHLRATVQHLGDSTIYQPNHMGIESDFSTTYLDAGTNQRQSQQQRNSSRTNREAVRPLKPQPQKKAIASPKANDSQPLTTSYPSPNSQQQSQPPASPSSQPLAAPQPQPLAWGEVELIARAALLAVKHYGQKRSHVKKTLNMDNYWIEALAVNGDWSKPPSYLTITASDGRGQILVLKGQNNNSQGIKVEKNYLSQPEVEIFSKVQAALDHFQTIRQLRQDALKVLSVSRDDNYSNTTDKNYKYQIVSDPQCLRIIALDGRGEILNYPNENNGKYGELEAKANFNQTDVERFAAKAKSIQQRQQQIQQQQQASKSRPKRGLDLEL